MVDSLKIEADEKTDLLRKEKTYSSQYKETEAKYIETIDELRSQLHSQKSFAENLQGEFDECLSQLKALKQDLKSTSNTLTIKSSAKEPNQNT